MKTLGPGLRLSLLSHRFEIRSDRPRILRVLRFQYGHFLAASETGAPHRRIRLRLAGARPALEVDGGRFELPRIPGADAYALGLIFEALLDRIGGYLFFHAGVVSSGERGVLICGPPGFGKTSLVLALVREGYGFLSDDFAPISLTSGRVAPFPRSLGIVAGARSSSPLLRRIPRRARIRCGGKWLVDPSGIPGIAMAEACRPDLVILLGPSESASAKRPPRFEISIDPSLAADLLRVLRRGRSRWRLQHSSRRFRTYRFTLSPGRNLTAQMESWVQEHRAGIFGISRFWDRPGSLRGRLRVLPVSPRRGVMEILGDLLNRRPGSRSLAELGSSPARLLLSAASLLSKARFCRLQGGSIEARSQAVGRLLEGAGTSSRSGL